MHKDAENEIGSIIDKHAEDCNVMTEMHAESMAIALRDAMQWAYADAARICKKYGEGANSYQNQSPEWYGHGECLEKAIKARAKEE